MKAVDIQHQEVLSLEYVARKIETILLEYCEKQLAQARHKSHERMWQTLRDVITGGGKRLRPYLCITAYHLSGKVPDDNIYAVAAAWEMLHQCMLIHDDIIDRDFVRHGTLNMNGQYRAFYAADQVASADRDHYANSAAIIAGDLALSAAYELILQSSLAPKDARVATLYLHQATHAVALGELQDTESAFETTTAADSLLVAEMKTASYSFIGPLQSGAALAGLPQDVIDQLGQFGKSLGIAFQFRDDVLSVFGDETKTGKPTDSDIREGKQTMLIHYAREVANKQQLMTLNKILGNHTASNEDIQVFKDLLQELGALKRVEAEIACYTEGAENALAALSEYSEGAHTLELLANRLLDRQG